MPSPSPAAHEEASVGVAEAVQTMTATDEAEAAINSPAMPAEPDAAIDEAADVISEPAGVSAEAADAYDDALLELIALEMAAADPAETPEPSEVYEDEAAELPPAERIIVAARPEPIAAPAVQPLPEPPVVSPLEPSLGSSLIANGIVRPWVSRPDPLAPIRRMSQTEKIAFFS
jgi:hypothetical protein